MDKTLYALVAFSSTDIIGSYRFEIIKKKFENIYDFLDCSAEDQMALLGLKTDRAKAVLFNMKKQADIILQDCERKKISMIPFDSVIYPQPLKEIEDPPYLLYCQGNFNPKVPLIGVIGTRNSTHDAEKINRHFSQQFVNFGFGVVSGLAQGHDAIAAETVLNHDGYTVGVLGTAIDTVYPKSSQKIFHSIREKGALLSEYPPKMLSTKWRFPRRNRIVSGMSQAIFVVQAPERSGTMITVNMALEQQKDVYVVPGNPLIDQNKGSNFLISKGAKIALSPQLVIEELLSSHPNLETVQFLSQAETAEELFEQSTPEEKQQTNDIFIQLSKEEQQILLLTENHIHIDELLNHLEMNISSLSSLLTMMEIKGLVIQKPGQIYIKGN